MALNFKQGLIWLIIFKVSEKIPLADMHDKYDRVLKYCDNETDRIFKLFKRQKDDPPLARNYAPISGK